MVCSTAAMGRGIRRAAGTIDQTRLQVTATNYRKVHLISPFVHTILDEKPYAITPFASSLIIQSFMK